MWTIRAQSGLRAEHTRYHTPQHLALVHAAPSADHPLRPLKTLACCHRQRETGMFKGAHVRWTVLCCAFRMMLMLVMCPVQ